MNEVFGLPTGFGSIVPDPTQPLNPRAGLSIKRHKSLIINRLRKIPISKLMERRPSSLHG